MNKQAEWNCQSELFLLCISLHQEKEVAQKHKEGRLKCQNTKQHLKQLYVYENIFFPQQHRKRISDDAVPYINCPHPPQSSGRPRQAPKTTGKARVKPTALQNIAKTVKQCMVFRCLLKRWGCNDVVPWATRWANAGCMFSLVQVQVLGYWLCQLSVGATKRHSVFYYWHIKQMYKK